MSLRWPRIFLWRRSYCPGAIFEMSPESMGHPSSCKFGNYYAPLVNLVFVNVLPLISDARVPGCFPISSHDMNLSLYDVNLSSYRSCAWIIYPMLRHLQHFYFTWEVPKGTFLFCWLMWICLAKGAVSLGMATSYSSSSYVPDVSTWITDHIVMFGIFLFRRPFLQYPSSRNDLGSVMYLWLRAAGA